VKKISIIAVCLLVAILCFGQHPGILKVSLVEQLKEDVKDFTTDNLGNIYLLTAGNRLKKVNEKGDSIAVYNDVRRYGKIYSIDATNPLKILVYYKDFSTIVMLDRLLNVRATINLRQQNILQATAVAASYDNNIWVFDELENKLKKIDESGKILTTSTDFRQIFDSVPTPNAMYDRDGQLYLYDPSKGLLVFDYYGGRKNNYQLLHFIDLQVIDKNTITGRDSNYIFLYKPASLQLSFFTAFKDQAAYKKINFNGSLLYCLTKDDKLQIFKVLE
jgi:DNA-binding beta-propeller fold protein YncE